jgi:hypothetical protein
MRKHVLLLLQAVVLTAAIASLTACRQAEIYSEYPAYGTLFFSADSIVWKGEIRPVHQFSPGQTVYVGITIERDGAYITRATQTWTLRGVGTEYEHKETRTVVGPVGREPVWQFQAPMEEGEYSVTFKEKYSFSAQQPNGTIFGESATLNSKFRVKE